ncbi:hypothetical protein HMPREF0673_00743 [Leyella stercorea DSM 18206]|uniref:Uncharacterized protein n=1 Tax=Leyella stercorea DSM 18206 TaxID=1002367 RepID=G6AVU8_9BACT|nr:hypothetical protein HMPREF0673_00743 [Leyella stercorea DSM 18206]
MSVVLFGSTASACAPACFFRLQIYRFLAKLRKVSTKSSAARLKNIYTRSHYSG